MSTPEALRRQFQEVLSRYQEALPTWPALTADAQGTLHVAGRPGWIHVRIGNDKIPAQAFNAQVGDYVDYPVIVGYSQEQPDLFQVLSARFVYAGADSGDDLLPQVVAHHRTHEFRRDGSGGGDTVWVQKQQIVPLQVSPTTTSPSMMVVVAADWYAWESGWRYFPGAVSADLSGYVPSAAAAARFVLISIDGLTNLLQYTPGDTFSILLPPAKLDDQLPPPPAGSVPAGAVYLVSSTTSLDWDNLYDIRLFNHPVGGSILPAQHDHSGPQQGGQNLRDIQEFRFDDATELTISSGAVTRTQVYHTIDTESDAASDDLDTINGGTEGDLLVIRAEDSARTVVVKTGTGNIVLSGGVDVTLDSDTDHLTLIFNGTNWCDDSSGGGGAPTDVQYLALALDATLTDERRFVAGAGIDDTDGGAGGDYTVTLADHDHSGDAGDGGAELAPNSVNIASSIWRLGETVLDLDFTGTDYDTKAKCQTVGLRFSDSDTPFPTWMPYNVIIGGTWSHTSGSGWKPTTGGGDSDGPAVLIPLSRPSNWQLLMTLDVSGYSSSARSRFTLGYYTPTNHVGAYCYIYDATTSTRRYVAKMMTNDGDDTFTNRYTGSQSTGLTTWRLGIRVKNGTVGIFDEVDDAWHDYSGHQSAGISYSPGYVWIRLASYGVAAIPTTYLSALNLTYLL